MKCCVVSFSQLEDRWDAAYYIMLQDMRGRLAALRSALPGEAGAAACRAMLEKIPLADKAPLLVLSRHGNPHLTADTIRPIQKEYPHLALAIMQANIAPIIQRAQATADQYRRLAAELEAMAKAIPSQEGPTDAPTDTP